MRVLNDYALLIGVEDYGAYDRSMDLPAGTSDVPGAINDAKTFFRTCISMGFAPERIRVLTSPRLSPRDLGAEATEANVGDATRDAILAGVRWLVEAIGGPAPAAGLLTFSGHGDQWGGVVVLPSDTTGSLEHAIDVTEVGQQIGRGAAAGALTVLLDCCHAEVGDPSAGGLAVRLLDHFSGEHAPESRVAERVLAASRRGQASVSSRFGGVWMGAFTWAVTSVMGQWKAVDEGGVARLDVTYGEVVTVTQALLAALAFRQISVLEGPEGVAGLPFLHPGPARHEGETSLKPDAPRDGRQLDGGWFTLTDTAHGGEVAQVFATSTYNITIDGASTIPSTEYWYVNDDAVRALSSTSALSIVFQSFTQGQACRAPVYTNKQSFTIGESASWVQNGSPLPAPGGGASFSFVGNGSSIYLQLTRSSSYTLAGIGWYTTATTPLIRPSGAYAWTARKVPLTAYKAATWTG